MDPILLQLLHGELNAFELPDRLDLGPLWPFLDELCSQSLGVPPGHLPSPSATGLVEWGRCIIRNGTTVVSPPGHLVPGTANGVTPPSTCVAPGHTPPLYAGYAHTHLLWQGLPIFGFSDRDYQASLVDGDNLALVCNGSHVFALARAADLTRAPGEPTAAEFADWRQMYLAVLAQVEPVMHANPAALQEALAEANMQMCEDLGFAFYAGSFRQPLRLIYRPL